MEEFLPILIIIALIINGLGLIFFALSFRQQSSDYTYQRPTKVKKEEVVYNPIEELEDETNQNDEDDDEDFEEDYKKYFKNDDDDEDDDDYRFNKYNEIEDDRPGSPKNRHLMQVDINNMDLHNYEGGEDDYNREDDGIEIHDLKNRSSKFKDNDYENSDVYKELKDYEEEKEEDLGNKYQISFNDNEEDEEDEEDIPVVEPQRNRQLLNTTSLLNQDSSDDEEDEEEEDLEEERLIIKQFEPLKYKDRNEFHQEEQEEISENEIEKRIEFLAGSLNAPLKETKLPKKRTDF